MNIFTSAIMKLVYVVLVVLIFRFKKRNEMALMKMLPITFNKNYKFGFLFYLMFSFVIGLALLDFKGPRVKEKRKTTKEKLTIILDYSSSMRVEDVGTSRYKLATSFIKDFIRESSGYFFRVVIYADKAYKVVPFTSDENYVQTKISAIKEGLYPDGGSDLHVGLKESFVDDSSGSTVILISDFENLDVGKINSVIESAGLNVFSVAVGTKSGGNIPRGNNKLLSGFLTRGGSKIVSKVDMESISKINHRKSYFLTKNKYPILELKDSLTKNKEKSGSGSSTDYLRKRYMPLFVLLGCLFLLISLFFRNIKKPVGFTTLLLLMVSKGILANDQLPQTNLELNDFANKIFFSDKKEDRDIPETIYSELKKRNLEKQNSSNVEFNLITSELKISKREKAINSLLSSEFFNDEKLSFEMRSNIVNLLRQSAKGGKGSGGQSDDESKGAKNSGDLNKQSPGKQKKNLNKELSDKDRRLLEKLIGDDQVSQAEYIKKKIKKSSRRGSVRW